MKITNVTLRCMDSAEALVFTKYDYESKTYHNDYDFSIEDSYCGGCGYTGFFGRVKRAWKAFKAEPVYYSSVIHKDKEKVREFLQDCLAVIEEKE